MTLGPLCVRRQTAWMDPTQCNCLRKYLDSIGKVVSLRWDVLAASLMRILPLI